MYVCECFQTATVPALGFLLGGASSSSSEESSSLLDSAGAAGLAGGVFTGAAGFAGACENKHSNDLKNSMQLKISLSGVQLLDL